MLSRSLLLLVFIVTVFTAIGQASRADSVKMICQKWKIKEMKIDSLDEDGKEDLEDMIKYSRIEFKSDMSLVDSNGETNEKGKWSLDGSGKILSLTFLDDTIKLEIITLSYSLLRFRPVDPDNGMFGTGSLVPVKN